MMNEMTKYQDIDSDLNIISGQIVDCAFQVHKKLGPGFLEINYEDALILELQKRNISFERQKVFKIPYDNGFLKSEFRFDLVIEGQIIIELKSVENIHPIHKAQTLAYMKAGAYPIGLLINFNVPLIKNGINRLTLRTSDTPC